MKRPLLPLPRGEGRGVGVLAAEPGTPTLLAHSLLRARTAPLDPLTPALSRRERGKRAGLALLLALLPGCTLIDQNTFRPGAGAAPVIPPGPPAPVSAAAFPGPPPLLILSAGQPATDALRTAVAVARARKPGVEFEVVAILPGTPTDEAIRSATLDAAGVARGIVAQGVPQSRVRVLARPEPAATVGDIRVYVR